MIQEDGVKGERDGDEVGVRMVEGAKVRRAGGGGGGGKQCAAKSRLPWMPFKNKQLSCKGT